MTAYYDRNGITIYQGDCLDVLPTLGAVDHVITDPPYARDVYLRARTQGGLANTFSINRGPRIVALAAGEIGAVDELIEPCSAEFGRLVQRWAITFSDVESCHLWRSALERSGMRYVRTGAWVKPDAMPQFSGDRPSTGFEPCTITHAQGPMRWNGGGLPALWTYNTVKGDARPDHPCPKPLALMRELVTLFTDPSDLILDPFMGSGTTLVAARLEGRRAIGIELERGWCEVAVNRLEHGDRGAAAISRGMTPLPWEETASGRGGEPESLNQSSPATHRGLYE